MGSVFDSLYTRLILRDVVGKIVPGSALLISLYLAALPPPGDFHAAIDAVRGMPASSWFIVAAAGWLTAFAIQAFGGWLPPKRFLPYIRYASAPLEDMFEYQRQHLRFARVAKDAETQIFERSTVVKEACGNASVAGFVSAGVLIFRYREPEALFLLGATVVGAVLLAKMHRDVLKLNTSILIDALDESTSDAAESTKASRAKATGNAPGTALLSLHRYFIWADRMRVHFDEVLRGTDDADRQSIDARLYMSYWYAGTYVVIEGWRDLRLQDAEIDELLQSPHVSLLKRTRNGVFHFQKNYFDARFLDFVTTDGTAVWVRTLNRAFGRFFLDWHKAHPQAESRET